MARKKAAIKNPAIPQPLQRFATAQAEERFKVLFSHRELLMEKGFDIDGSSAASLPDYVTQQITQRRWQTFCSQPDFAIPAVVQEFYSNFIKATAESVFVRGKEVPLNSTAINAVYELRDVECEYSIFKATLTPDDWANILQTLTEEGTEWIVSKAGSRTVLRSSLLQPARVWHHFVKTRLMPSSHDTTLAQDRLILLYCLLAGLNVNVGNLILEELRGVRNWKKGKLFFPCLITELCLQAGVLSPKEEEQIANSGLITAATINRLGRELPPILGQRRNATASRPQQSNEPGQSSGQNATSNAELLKFIEESRAFQTTMLAQQQAYWPYREQFDNVVKDSLQKIAGRNLREFPKFPELLSAKGKAPAPASSSSDEDPDEDMDTDDE